MYVNATAGGGMSGALSEVAKTSTQIFRWISIAQLLLMCFLAPIFTAGAITQEKDAETFNVLLTTPLSNAQIILGSLLSRLFFVITLLFSGLPIFCITMIYGGVTFAQIILSFAIAGSTAIVTGSLAIMISMMRTGTRRTIFSFGMAIALYLLVVWALGHLRGTWVVEAPPIPGELRRMSWLAAFHPYLSLEVGLSKVPAPALAEVAHYGWPAKFLFAFPHISYVVMTMLLSALMICLSMFFVRSGTREGEPTFFNRMMARLRLSRGEPGERRRKPHRVWANPMAWREATTRAATATSTLSRYGLMIAGTAVSLMVLIYLIKGWDVMKADGTTAAFSAADARMWLMWLVTVELVLILLVVTNAAATSMTKERESNTMDILLTTPLTSESIVWGKLRGLIAFAMPMLAVPIINLAIFVAYDVIAGHRGSEAVVYFESVVLLALLMVVQTALAAVIGLHTSLKSKKTVRAVLVSITIMTILCGLLFVIADAVIDDVGSIGPALSPFTPFTAVKGLINGSGSRDFVGYSFAGTPGVRIAAMIGGCIAVVVYAAVVGAIYKSLVRNFHMTVRKQSAS